MLMYPLFETTGETLTSSISGTKTAFGLIGDFPDPGAELSPLGLTGKAQVWPLARFFTACFSKKNIDSS